MDDWLSPNRAIPQSVVTAPDRLHQDAMLRTLDLVLVLLVTFVLLMACPVLLIVAVRGDFTKRMVCGAQGQPFLLFGWRLGDTRLDRVLIRMGAHHWPSLWNIALGQLAWVGPRLRTMSEVEQPLCLVRPGLFTLHALRQKTAVDFMTEVQSEAEHLIARGLAYDLRLLVLSLWTAAVSPTARPSEWQPRVCIGGVWVDNLDMASALDEVNALMIAGDGAQISFVNPDCVNIAARNPAYREHLAASSRVLPDGIGMRMASGWLGTPIRQNVNGTDFVPRLFTNMQTKLPTGSTQVFLLGARPEVVARVAEEIKVRWPGISVVGARHGYFNREEEAAICETIRTSGARMLLVAMGAPLQEAFIARNRAHFRGCVAIGVGGLFDFIAGRVSRAPQWMRDAGFEWIWRLMQEPGRMWRRYLIGNMLFVFRVLMQRMK